MIDISTEHLLTFPEAIEHLPVGRNGKKRALSTVYAWSSKGCHGVVLEKCYLGSTPYTSREAIQRFSDRLTAKKNGGVPVPTTKTRQQQIDRAYQQLAAAGAVQ